MNAAVIRNRVREVIGKRTNSPSVKSTLGYREVSTALAREAK
jgi:hypothetical protein